MPEGAANIEDLLRQAFKPVDPPDQMADRLQKAVVNIAELAADELESLEPDALRDPRNWARPAAAVVAGATAGAALVVLEMRRRSHQGQRQRGEIRGLVNKLGAGRSGSASSPAAKAAEFGVNAGRTLRDLADEARKMISN